MNLYFDTSALVKFFHKEKGTEIVTEWITSKDHDIWISEIAHLEFVSALLRRFRNKELTDKKLEIAVSAFEDQLNSFNIEPLAHAVIEESKLFLKRYGKTNGLKTLDAIHLGTFGLIAGGDWILIAADSCLCQVGKLASFRVANPLETTNHNF